MLHAGARGGNVKAVRVLVAHPNEVVCEALTKVISNDPRVAVVASASTGEDIIKKASISWPTVVVMDIAFPDMGAGRVIRALSQARLPLAVLICSETAVKGSAQLTAAVKEGAFDFILLPQDPEEIEKIGRQILTQIHVTGFTKTKVIPQVDPAVEVKTEVMLQQHARLNAVVIDVAPAFIDSVKWLLARVHPQGEPAVIAILRAPNPAGARFLEDIGPKLHAQATLFQDGVTLQPGHIVLLDETRDDQVLGFDNRGRAVLNTAAPDSARRLIGPSPMALYESLAKHYQGSLAIVMFGKPSVDSSEGMVAAKQCGALTLAFEQSPELLDDLAKRFPDAQCPDDILTLEQIDRFMNSVLIQKG